MACGDHVSGLHSLSHDEPVSPGNHGDGPHGNHGNSITNQDSGGLGMLYDIPLCIVPADPLTESLDVLDNVEPTEALKLDPVDPVCEGLHKNSELQISGLAFKLAAGTNAERNVTTCVKTVATVTPKGLCKVVHNSSCSSTKDSGLKLSKEVLTIDNRNIWIVRPTEMPPVTGSVNKTVQRTSACFSSESLHQNLQISDPVPDVIAAETVVMTTPQKHKHLPATSLLADHNFLLGDNTEISGEILSANQTDFFESGEAVPSSEETLLALASVTSSMESSLREHNKKERDRKKKKVPTATLR